MSLEQKKTTDSRMRYEPDADVLSLELNKKEISHAKEIGNVIIHVTKDGMPVYLEFLEATKFFDRAQKLLRMKSTPTAAPAMG